MEVQCECQSLRKAIAIEEMAEGLELVSDGEEQAHTNWVLVSRRLAARNLAKCHAAGHMRRVWDGAQSQSLSAT